VDNLLSFIEYITNSLNQSTAIVLYIGIPVMAVGIELMKEALIDIINYANLMLNTRTMIIYYFLLLLYC
jgi:hypothetical protein